MNNPNGSNMDINTCSTSRLGGKASSERTFLFIRANLNTYLNMSVSGFLGLRVPLAIVDRGNHPLNVSRLRVN